MYRYGLIALLAVALPAGADIYKWVDDKGKVHYSDQPPPPGVNVKQQATERAPKPQPSAVAAPAQPGATPAAGAAPAPKTTADHEMEFRKRQVEKQEAEAKRQQQLAEAETKKRNCEQARNRLAGLQAGGRITKYSPTGEIIYLGDEEIAKEIAEAQRAADSWCK